MIPETTGRDVHAQRARAARRPSSLELPGGIAAKAIEPIVKSQLEKSFDQRQAATKAILEADARA